jgi:hypothetical protein
MCDEVMSGEKGDGAWEMGIPTCIASNILLSRRRESFSKLMDQRLCLDGRGGQREGFVGRGKHCEIGRSGCRSIYTDLVVEKENDDGHACLNVFAPSPVRVRLSLAFAFSRYRRLASAYVIAASLPRVLGEQRPMTNRHTQPLCQHRHGQSRNCRGKGPAGRQLTLCILRVITYLFLRLSVLRRFRFSGRRISPRPHFRTQGHRPPNHPSLHCCKSIKIRFRL